VHWKKMLHVASSPIFHHSWPLTPSMFWCLCWDNKVGFTVVGKNVPWNILEVMKLTIGLTFEKLPLVIPQGCHSKCDLNLSLWLQPIDLNYITSYHFDSNSLETICNILQIPHDIYVVINIHCQILNKHNFCTILNWMHLNCI